LGPPEEMGQEARKEGEGRLGSLQEEDLQEHQEEEGVVQEGLGLPQEEGHQGHQEDEEEG